jgi:hypothetical protein
MQRLIITSLFVLAAACRSTDHAGMVKDETIRETDFSVTFAPAAQLPEPHYGTCREQISSMTVDQTLTAVDEQARVFIAKTTPEALEAMREIALTFDGKELKCLVSAGERAR